MASKLETMIKQASQKYYSDGSSEYTDEEFDKMLTDLKNSNPESSLLSDVGHGYDVYDDTTFGERRKHDYGDIIGLDKCHNWKELKSDFKSNDAYFITPKIDGMSIVCYFKHSELDHALTRGSKTGDIGIDVTNKVRYILQYTNICKFTSDFTGAIRGEIVMSEEKFDQIKQKYPLGFDGKKAFSNPRNTTAGIMNRKTNYESDLPYLTILFYYVVGQENDYMFQQKSECTYDYIMMWLSNNLNINNVVPMRVTKLSEDTFEETMIDCRDRLSFSNFYLDDYPTDGLVINSVAHYDKNTFEISYLAQAFKFPSEQCDAKVVDIRWNMSKNNLLIPVIQIEPVQLSGTQVEYVTGFNALYISNNAIHKGTIVTITKSGEIIPYILGVKNSEQVDLTESVLPGTCPECGHLLDWEGVHIRCNNSNCPNIQKQDLLAWVDHLVELDNFGDNLRWKYLSMFLGDDTSIENLMNKLTTSTYSKTDSVQANLFVDMLNRLSNDTFKLSSCLEALNIPRLGSVNSRKLAEYPDVVKLLVYNDEVFPESELIKILGDATKSSINKNKWKFHRLRYIWNRVDTSDNSKKQKVAVTGKLSVKRKMFEKELSDNGYILSELSKECVALITNDPSSNSEKNKKATAWNIEKITEAEFRQKYFN